ncbi:MAG: ChuX/HutX family heme-like substrate-binding protein [Spongiibacteraceae bacterium]
MTTSTLADPILELQQRHQLLVNHEPKLRARDRASRLGITEAELVAAQCGVRTTALIADVPNPFQTIFRELGSLGRVMALTRNDGCVHERHGRYETIQVDAPVGLVLGKDIDLRIFFAHWRYGYAVEESGRLSLQFFDAAGDAVHKIFLTEHSDIEAYTRLLARFGRPVSELPIIAPIPITATSAGREEKPTPDNVTALRNAWLALKDTHDFHGMLTRFGVSRLGALRAAGADLAQEVAPQNIETVLNICAATALPLMCFVGNRGMIQIHTGCVHTLRRTGPWYNVLDADFNLHLNTEAITSCWIVNKPTVDGWITSLETFAADGSLIVQFFGARKPGKPELPEWRNVLASLCREPLAA